MDYYQTLGVERTATPEEIKKAYRRMAAKHHPDRGGSTAEFQKIEEAYRILSDPEQRSRHDNPQQFNGFPGGFNFGHGNPFDDIFRQFHQQRQRVYTVSLFVTLEQVANGNTETVQFNTPQGIKTFNIQVPKGIEDGQQIRYDGMMSDGILQIEFRVHRHPIFDRRGLDLYVTERISVFDLILGTKVQIPTIYGGKLEVTIPEKTNPGTTLRISGKGLSTNGRTGDQFLLISSFIPDTISDELMNLLRQENQRISTN